MKFFRFFLPGFQQNWKVVMLSIMGAATFWFFNAMNKTYDTRIDYPLSYSFDRDSVVIVKPLTKRIKIDITSGGWNLIRRTLKISATPIEITLENPTDIKYLTRSSLIPMLTDQLHGLKLNYIVTDTLFFDIEQKIVKKMPLFIDSLGIPLEDNFRIISPIEFNNDSVTLIGPKSSISSLQFNIEMAFKDVEIDSDFESELSYRLDPIIKAIPEKTVVRFEVSQFLLKELLIPIEFLNFPSDSSIVASQPEIKLYYTVNEDFENDVNTTDFSVTVDFNMMNAKDSTVAPLLMYAHDKALDIVLNVDKVRLVAP
ncbi:MAG: hypothetical protein JXR07_03930 [Reichenbachiella sp.]